jgi:hypothetical protein
LISRATHAPSKERRPRGCRSFLLAGKINLPSRAEGNYRLRRDSEKLDHHDNDLAFIRKMDERHASH